ncbi:hypothetical protein GCM10023186_20230 [Hymenobacter koreensis]|uniref:Uncharacterized protein n=1 Tax=Hymenobacter koreensis TaxID=1084523 RepID=A0ABP8IYW8_9BACT
MELLEALSEEQPTANKVVAASSEKTMRFIGNRNEIGEGGWCGSADPMQWGNGKNARWVALA